MRTIWLVCEELEDWMPDQIQPRDWWVLFTNQEAWSPTEVIQAYKSRWEIEVFFRAARQRMALGNLPGRDFRQVQAHVCFVFLGYLLLMLVRHLAPIEADELRIMLKTVQEQVLMVKAVVVERGKTLNVHFTDKNWLYYHEAAVTLG